MIDLVTCGESLVAMTGRPVVGSHMTLGLRGAESTVAIALARLGHSTRWVSRLGPGPLGDLVIRELRAEGVDVSAVRRDAGRSTGLVIETTASWGVRALDVHRDGSAIERLAPDLVVDLFSPPVRIVHLNAATAALSRQAESLMLAAVDRARRDGVAVSLDLQTVVPLPADADPIAPAAALARRADIVFAGERDLARLTPDAESTYERANDLLDAGVSEVVVVRGPRGSSCFTHHHRVDAPAFPGGPAAEDVPHQAFVGGYLHGWLDGEPLSVRLAQGAALLAASGDGYAGLPDAARLAATLGGTAPGRASGPSS